MLVYKQVLDALRSGVVMHRMFDLSHPILRQKEKRMKIMADVKDTPEMGRTLIKNIGLY